MTGFTADIRLWKRPTVTGYGPSPVPNVFERKFLYQYGQTLDVDKMKKAAQALVGTHDFASFCGNRHMKKSTVRTIFSH